MMPLMKKMKILILSLLTLLKIIEASSTEGGKFNKIFKVLSHVLDTTREIFPIVGGFSIKIKYKL